jgi:hypothetical protein
MSGTMSGPFRPHPLFNLRVLASAATADTTDTTPTPPPSPVSPAAAAADATWLPCPVGPCGYDFDAIFEDVFMTVG